MSDLPNEVLPYFKRQVSDGSRHFECGCFWRWHVEPKEEEHTYYYCENHIHDHDSMFKQLEASLEAEQ